MIFLSDNLMEELLLLSFPRWLWLRVCMFHATPSHFFTLFLPITLRSQAAQHLYLYFFQPIAPYVLIMTASEPCLCAQRETMETLYTSGATPFGPMGQMNDPGCVHGPDPSHVILRYRSKIQVSKSLAVLMSRCLLQWSRPDPSPCNT